jgi:P-type conjugative transfer protein TrbG
MNMGSGDDDMVERVSDIALQPGEVLIAVSAVDTARWTVGDTVSGTGAAQRTHIMIKPLAPGLKTNIVITTDRRVYRLALESSARSAMASIGWTYPEDGLIAIERSAEAVRAKAVATAAIDPVSFGFSYVIRGDDPPWRPLRAFDDGRQVFIEFPAALTQDAAPPLFLVGESGSAELVNYRLSGRFYIVDRLFAIAELRLGEKRQIVVRICNSARLGKQRCKGRGK